MERREFLETLGLGAAFVLTTSCLQSCAKASGGAVDFTLDLTLSANAAIKIKGGYLITNGVVVAYDNNGKYVAATNTCSHEGQKQVLFNASAIFRKDFSLLSLLLRSTTMPIILTIKPKNGMYLISALAKKRMGCGTAEALEIISICER